MDGYEVIDFDWDISGDGHKSRGETHKFSNVLPKAAAHVEETFARLDPVQNLRIHGRATDAEVEEAPPADAGVGPDFPCFIALYNRRHVSRSSV